MTVEPAPWANGRGDGRAPLRTDVSSRSGREPSSGAGTLVIHPGALGDVLQAVPALRALRNLEAGAPVTFAGQMRLGQLLAGAGVVGACLSFEGLGLEALFGLDSPTDAVQSRLATFARVVSWFGARTEPFPDRLGSIVRIAVVAPPVPPDGSPLRVWEHLLETVRSWGVTAPSMLSPLDLPDAWRAAARRLLSRLGVDHARRFLLVHPGAGARGKRWPVGSLARVIRDVVGATGCQVVLHQGPADEDAVGELVSAAGLPMLRVLEPPLSLLAGVLREAGAYLGADSGVSHLAAAAGAPAVILFAPATRDRWAPWSPTALPLMLLEALEETAALAAGMVAQRLSSPVA
jgi:glycosyl transferase family 9 (putative heptosyltransferase)